MAFSTNNNPVYRGVRPIKPEEITEPTESIKAPSVAPMIPGSPSADSHVHHSGLIAQASSDAKGSLHKGGFFEPKPTQFTNTKK